jgi:basic membrane lipoprotein Med (substrate-binding protein (PBP1-ABC) superfamily)
MDTAVFGLVHDWRAGALQPGTRELDYASGGVGLAPLDGGLVPADSLAAFMAIRRKVEAGGIAIEPAPVP